MKPVGLRDPAHRPAALGRRCNCARKTCAPTATTSSASRTTCKFRRAGARPAPDPRPRKRATSCATARFTATPTSTRPRCCSPRPCACTTAPLGRHLLRRPDLRRRRLHRIHRHRPAGRPLRGRHCRGEDAHARSPRETALGSLVHYITHADPRHFQPANITFDLLEPLEEETAQEDSRQERAAPHPVRAGAGRLRRLVGKRRLSPAGTFRCLAKAVLCDSSGRKKPCISRARRQRSLSPGTVPCGLRSPLRSERSSCLFSQSCGTIPRAFLAWACFCSSRFRPRAIAPSPLTPCSAWFAGAAASSSKPNPAPSHLTTLPTSALRPRQAAEAEQPIV